VGGRRTISFLKFFHTARGCSLFRNVSNPADKKNLVIGALLTAEEGEKERGAVNFVFIEVL